MRPLIMILAMAAQTGFAGIAVAGSAEIERGRYLATAADCAACHTNPAGGKRFAGGYAIPSPLGVIYSTNITPSKSYGIGNYSEAQFERALREGVRADGGHLYPAMPYTAFAKLTAVDVRALYAYFMQNPPVDAPTPPTRLPFPFDQRWSMAAWNTLFLKRGQFLPDQRRSAEWNRGAYLAEALEHCSDCHTPRNLLMGEKSARNYAGAPVGPWYAPNITGDPVSGIGGWSRAELFQYLKTGAVPGKGRAAGGMAEAVSNSLQYLTDQDLNALITYMQAIPPIRERGATRPDYAWGAPATAETKVRGMAIDKDNEGAVYYSRYCASCHQPAGAGVADNAIPSLFNNVATGSGHHQNLIAAILYGVRREAGGQKVLMPNFGAASYVQPLDDHRVARIAGYILATFGNPDAQVTDQDVAVARMGGPRSALIAAFKVLAATVSIAGLVVIVLVWSHFRRQRRAAP